MLVGLQGLSRKLGPSLCSSTMGHRHGRLHFRKKMLCKTDHLCVFPSGIALEKDLPMYLVGVDYCIYQCCFGDRSGCRAVKIFCAGKSYYNVLKQFQAWAVHQA